MSSDKVEEGDKGMNSSFYSQIREPIVILNPHLAIPLTASLNPKTY